MVELPQVSRHCYFTVGKNKTIATYPFSLLQHAFSKIKNCPALETKFLAAQAVFWQLHGQRKQNLCTLLVAVDRFEQHVPGRRHRYIANCQSLLNLMAI